jgi:hypothetical protein
MEESIASLKRSLKGMKYDWKSKEKHATIMGFADGYVPLSMAPVGYPDCLYGAVRLRHSAAMGVEAGAFSSSFVCGLRVSAKQCTHQTRGWEAFHTLTNLVSARTLNLFPVPLTATIEASGSTLLAFDYPERCRSLGSLLGAVGSSSVRSNDVFAPGALAVFLRKYPDVVATWCMQLGATYRAFVKAAAHDALAVPIDVFKDVYVKDNGALLIGNCAFGGGESGGDASSSSSGGGTSNSSCRSSSSSCSGSSSSSGSSGPGRSLFTDFMRGVLEHALCLSRRVEVGLVPEGSLDREADDDSEAEGEVGKGHTRRSVIGHSTLAVTAGSTLDISPIGVAFKSVLVDHARSPLGGTEDAREVGAGVLVVSVVGDPHAADVVVLHAAATATTVATAITNPTMFIRIEARAAGVLALVLKLKCADSNTTFMSKVHIKVVPDCALPHVDVVEMIELLQSSDAGSAGGGMFLRAQALRKVSYDEVHVSKVWDRVVEALVPFKQ